MGTLAVIGGGVIGLTSALALAADGERVCWVARDAEIGDRVAEELGAWLGDPSLVAVLEPRTSLAYERSELVPDETAARVAALAAWRTGAARVLVASVQALLQATLAPEDLPDEVRRVRLGSRLSLDTLLAERVVLAWLFVHWCEYQYAAQLAKLTWKQSEFHTRRIEMGHRNLLSACRTLAKVKKAKLPDVLALVNVTPPASNG